MERLTLTRSAELVVTYWHYDAAADKGEDRERRVEHLDVFIMHSVPCYFEEGLLLGDVFRFMSKHVDFLNVTLGAECEAIVQEGLQEPGEGAGDLDYVELYWSLETETHRGETTTRVPERMDFDGVGKPRPGDASGKPPDAEVRYAIELSAANDLARYPIRIDPKLEARLRDLDAGPGAPDQVVPLGQAQPTLFQALYGIVWELSFFGSPEEREKMKSELDRRMRSIEDGTAKPIPMEDVFGPEEQAGKELTE